MGRPALNILGAALSTRYITLKYYLDSLKTKKKNDLEPRPTASSHNINFANLDPREDFSDQHLKLIEDLKQIQTGKTPDQVTSIGANLSQEEEGTIIELLRNNIDLFAWTPADMPGIDPSFIYHKLSLRPAAKPIKQRKRKLGIERRQAVAEKTQKLLDASFIKEI